MPPEFDIIFAGGGTTACVIAGRLTAADPYLRILVVESGQHTNVPEHVQPCKCVKHITPPTSTLSCHVARPNIHLNGRAIVIQSGRGVGGGSTVNFVVYTRGAASDYDDWKALGNKGWGFNDVLPLFRKLETFAPISSRPTHGYSGPVQVSSGGVDLGLGKQFLDVARAYDPCRPQVDDHNDFKTSDAYSLGYKYIDPVTGKRSDAASRYLYPHSNNPNLKIMTGKHVKRVIIEDGRAVGIECMPSAVPCQGDSDDVVTVKAAKLVIVSAGALGSPSILERSGIGSPSILEKNDIPVLVDLPGVGESYQDHFGACPAFYASNETETMDDVWSDPEAVAALSKEWEGTGRSKVAHNGIEAIVKMRPTAAQLVSSTPALQERWNKFFRNNPDKSMAMTLAFAGFPLDPSLSSGLKLLSATYYILYPESVGSVHITSGNDVNSPLDLDYAICSKAGDVAQLIMLYKMTRELFRRMPAYRGEVTAHHPAFPPGSPATCREADEPVPIDAPDIMYSDADDEAIAKFHRDRVFTIWHSLGTCAMKPRDQGGVVDACLNVYGVKGLKVADLSICPTNVGNNTYSTALLIGEKAATIIAEDLGVKVTW